MSKQDRIRQLTTPTNKNTCTALLALAAQMDHTGVSADDPVREIFGLLGDKWSKLILLVLDCGVFGYGELQRTMEALATEPSVPRRVLTLKLRALERDGFVRKELGLQKTAKSAYSLTPLGKELTERVKLTTQWITDHHDDIKSARLAYDNTNEI